jgi:antiviral helicase SLH1
MKKLTATNMVTIDPRTNAYVCTDLGRIAARYYIRHESIEIFNEHFRPKMSEADVLALLSMSVEVGDVSFDVHTELMVFSVQSNSSTRK